MQDVRIALPDAAGAGDSCGDTLEERRPSAVRMQHVREALPDATGPVRSRRDPFPDPEQVRDMRTAVLEPTGPDAAPFHTSDIRRLALSPAVADHLAQAGEDPGVADAVVL